MFKAFKYRLYPNKTQQEAIDRELRAACFLYNCALEHRINTYKETGKGVTYNQQSAELKQARLESLPTPSNFAACQATLRRLDKSYKAFFKRGNGFPRFKANRRYSTLEFPSYGDGCKLRGKKAYFQGIGEVNTRLHRIVEGKIKTTSISRKNKKYYVVFVCEVTSTAPVPIGKQVGIDVGLESFATLSTGERISNPTFFKKGQVKLRVLQRSVAHKKRGSNSRKKAVHLLTKQHESIANQRADFLHKVSSGLVNSSDKLVVEDLQIKKMAGKGLGKQIHDTSWGIFFNMLEYKAESAGKQVVKVDPRGTSQRCHNCGNTVKKKLSDRWHSCDKCGVSCHRDVNSAKEILRLGTSLGTLTCPTRESVVPEATIK